MNFDYGKAIGIDLDWKILLGKDLYDEKIKHFMDWWNDDSETPENLEAYKKWSDFKKFFTMPMELNTWDQSCFNFVLGMTCLAEFKEEYKKKGKIVFSEKHIKYIMEKNIFRFTEKEDESIVKKYYYLLMIGAIGTIYN